MSYQIYFKDGGSGLSSVKSTCAGDGIVADAEGYGIVSADDVWYGSVAAAAAGDGIFSASAAGDGSVAGAAGCGIVSADAGYGSAVGCTVVFGRLGKGTDGALC